MKTIADYLPEEKSMNEWPYSMCKEYNNLINSLKAYTEKNNNTLLCFEMQEKGINCIMIKFHGNTDKLCTDLTNFISALMRKINKCAPENQKPLIMSLIKSAILKGLIY